MSELKRFDTFEVSGIRTMDWYDADEVDAYLTKHLPNEANKLRHTTRLLTRASIALKESVAYRMDDQPEVEQLILDINANLQYKDEVDIAENMPKEVSDESN